MTVQDKETRILDYIEGELSEEQERILREDLEKDPELKSLLESYQAQDRLLNGYFDSRAEELKDIGRPELGTTASAKVHGDVKRSSRLAWMAAAAAVVVVAGSTYLLTTQEQMVEGLNQVVYTTGEAQGFRLDSTTPVALNRGETVGLFRVKTPENSRMKASLRHDLGTIELNENSLASVRDTSDAVTVELERGEMIVQANRPVGATHFVRVSTPQFDVTTEDGTVTVTRGLRGSEVGVIFGEAELRISGGARKTLRRGESFSSTGVRPMPLITRVEWSDEKDELIAVLPRSEREVSVEPEAETTTVALATATETPQEPAAVTGTLVNDDTPALEIETTDSKEVAAVAVATSAASAGAGLTAFAPTSSARTTGYLPSDTFALLELTDTGSALSRENVNNLADILFHQNLKTFLTDSVGNAIGDEDTDARIEFDGKLDEVFSNEDAKLILNSLRGSMTVGLSEHGPFAVAEITDNQAQVAYLVETKIEPFLMDGKIDQHGKRLRFAASNDVLLIGIDNEGFAEALASIEGKGASGFLASSFLKDLRTSTSGSHLTGAMDMSLFLQNLTEKQRLSSGEMRFLERTGLMSMKSIIAATNFTDQAENMGLRVTFDERREGFAGWLGKPGPLNSFQFFSPDTHVVAAARIKRPGEMLREMFYWQSDGVIVPSTEPELALLARIADTLGNEVAIGLDNPVLPVPNVKATVEVLDPIGFHDGMVELITAMWEVHAPGESKAVDVKTTTYRGFLLVDFVYPDTSWGISYAVVDDYVVFGPGRPFLQSSIDAFVENQSLAQEYAFLEALPAKSGSHSSALLYATANQSMSDALPYLEGILKQYEIPFSVNIFTHRPVKDSKSAVYYAIAGDDSIDLYANGVKGKMQMTGILPAVANWLGQ